MDLSPRGRRPASVLFELRAPAELGLFVTLAPLLHAAPKGTGRKVLVMPGFGMGDASTLPLRLLLTRLGHEPAAWGQGYNLGPTEEILRGIVERLRALAEEAGEPIPIVGWSLGGVYARALAQWHPDLVDQVISLGSPFNISPADRTSLDHLYALFDRSHRFVRRRGEIDLDEVPCPSTAVFTRSDGVVAWESCRQTGHSRAENIEVRGSHCGLGVNVGAIYAIADRLTRSRHNWQPFDAPGWLRPFFPSVPSPASPTLSCAN